MQSPDFVEGVSGWRLSKDRLELYGAHYPVILGKLDEPEPEVSEKSPKPFIIVDGVTYIRQAKLDANWQVKIEPLNGKYVATGVGVGLESQFLVDADRYAVGGYVGNGPQPGDAPKAGSATSMLDAMACTISETSLGKDLLNEIGKGPAIADQVRDILRAELRPGGMLHLR
jgi:hypothetical protein